MELHGEFPRKIGWLCHAEHLRLFPELRWELELYFDVFKLLSLEGFVSSL